MTKEDLIKQRYNEQFFEDITFDYATPLTLMRNIEEEVYGELYIETGAGGHLFNCVYGYGKGDKRGHEGLIPLTDKAEMIIEIFKAKTGMDPTFTELDQYVDKKTTRHKIADIINDTELHTSYERILDEIIDELNLSVYIK